jgi:transposase-like protein/sugar lactone lactonase YvrE
VTTATDYPNDDACLDYLWREHFSNDGVTAVCPRCQAPRRFRRVANQRSYRCRTCGYNLHPTAGTILNRSSTPLRSWFRAILLAADPDRAVSAKDLQRELGVTYKTAWRMLRLIRAQLDASRGKSSGEHSPLAVATRPPSTPRGPRQAARARRRRHPMAPGFIVTFAGNGTAGYSGDGGPAAEAQLFRPWDIALDRAGNVFIADAGAHVIRRVDPSGTIATVAGNGRRGYSGDGGPATAATLHGPTGVAVDEEGGLLIADHLNHVVRRVDPGGTISTVAGDGNAGFSGDGGPARAARLNMPARIVAAGDSFLVADYRNNRVRRVDGRGIIDTIAGNGDDTTSGDSGPAPAAGLPRPNGLALDADGNLYVVQVGGSLTRDARVRRVDAGGTITTTAGGGWSGYEGDGGPAITARLSAPSDVAFDGSGRAIICDSHNNRIRRVDHSGTIRTIVGTGEAASGGNGGPAIAGQVNQPVGIAMHVSGDLLIADRWSCRVRRVSGPIPDE